MASVDNKTTYWEVSPNLSGTLELKTKDKYLDKNIKIKSAQDITGTGSCTVSGGGLSKGTASGGGLTVGTGSGGGLSQGTASGGAISGGGLSAGSGSVSAGTNVGLSATDTYACSLTVTGSGSVNRAAITRSAVSIPVNRAAYSQPVNRAAFSQSVTRADIKDAHTAGYIAAKDATTVISSASETVSLSSGTINASLSSGTINATLASATTSSTTLASNSATKYITSLTIPAGKTFGSATAKDALKLSSGTSMTALTKAYMTMGKNSVLYLTDEITGKTWTIECDSINNALTINQE